MDEGRIEKATRRARFVLSGGCRIRGEVFVGLYEPHHPGPQRVGEVLNAVRAKTMRGEFCGTVFVNLPDVPNRVQDSLN